jgi:arginyl-tRNA synthetase
LNPLKKHIGDIVADISGIPLSKVLDTLEIPPDENFGDYGFPCFQLARQFKQAPAMIAKELASRIAADDFIKSVSAEGPYINFKLKEGKVIDHVCREIFARGEEYGKSDVGEGKTIIIEYSSPNIAKPMSIGHLRSTVIGAALKRIYENLGYKVISINHLGDWGTQFGKLVTAYRRWADEKKMETEPIKELYRVYVKIHEEAESNDAIDNESRGIFSKLEAGDAEIVELWRKFVDLSWQEFKRIYDILGIKFDFVHGESFYQDKLPNVIDLLKKKNLCQVSQGALIVPLDQFDMEPLLLRKKDGSTLYATRDLAAAMFRYDNYKFDRMLYVVGGEQSLHFRQFFKVLELAGFDWVNRCRHVDFGWVKLGSEMMSTRKGNVVFLEDVLDQAVNKAAKIIETNSPNLENKEIIARQVGVGAVVFTDLSVRRQTDVSFDWDRMLDFQGHSGPYLQYAHARLGSVLRKYGEAIDAEADYSLLRFPEEYGLAKMMLDFPDRLTAAAETNEPNIITAYLLDLVGLFSTYFQKYKSPEDKILAVDKDLRKARVSLAFCLKTVLKAGLTIQGLEAPERM